MANPFKQYLPEEEPPKEELGEEVMQSIYIKSHFAGILEFFLAIMGITIRDSMVPAPEKDSLSKKRKDLDDPDYFF